MDKTLLAVIVAIVVVITGFIIYDGMYDDTAKVSTTPTSTPVANTS